MTGAETVPGIVDAHHHMWDLSVRDQDWISGDELAPLRRDFTLADLAPEARAAGVTATVLVQTITVPEETPEFLALAADSDLVAGVVGWTDLTAPDVAETLARLRAGFEGSTWWASATRCRASRIRAGSYVPRFCVAFPRSPMRDSSTTSW